MKRIFIVEKDAEWRYLLKYRLSSMGFKTYAYDDPVDALIQATFVRPDVLISDTPDAQVTEHGLFAVLNQNPFARYVHFIYLLHPEQKNTTENGLCLERKKESLVLIEEYLSELFVQRRQA